MKVGVVARNRHQKHIYDDAKAQIEKKQEENKIPKEVEHDAYNGNLDTTIRRTLEIRPFPIVIGIPMDELMFSQFFSNIICLSIMPWDSFVTTSDTLIENARNTIHNRFLEKSNAPYLLMLDSDVLPPPDTIERLLAHDLPAVGGWYRKKEKYRIKELDGTERIVQRPVVYDYDGFNEKIQKFEYRTRIKPGEGLEKIDGLGAGCWLIKREVLEKVGKSPFSFKFGGEDLDFCRKMKAAGYDIYVDWDVACAHSGVFFV